MSKRYFPEDLTIKKTKSIVALAGKPPSPMFNVEYSYYNICGMKFEPTTGEWNEWKLDEDDEATKETCQLWYENRELGLALTLVKDELDDMDVVVEFPLLLSVETSAGDFLLFNEFVKDEEDMAITLGSALNKQGVVTLTDKTKRQQNFWYEKFIVRTECEICVHNKFTGTTIL